MRIARFMAGIGAASILSFLSVYPASAQEADGKEGFGKRFKTGVKYIFKPEDDGGGYVEQVTDDKQIVFNIDAEDVPRARVEAIVNEQSVSVWTVGEEGGSGTTGAVDGDLHGVAIAAMKARLFELAPDALVTQKAFAAGQEGLTYRVSIDEFKEFRNSVGDFVYAIDAKLEVMNPDGTPAQSPVEYHFPSGKNERLTDEEFQELIEKNETAIVALDTLDQATSNSNSGIVGAALNFGAKYGKEKKRRQLEQQKLNLVSMSPGVKTYQMQESLVRKAIDQLMRRPIRPGDSEPVLAKFKYKKLRGEEVAGLHYLEQGDVDEALEKWSAITSPSPALRYNLGVVHLRLGSNTINSDPPSALTHVKKAEEHLAGLSAEFKKDGDLITLPTRVLKQVVATRGGIEATPDDSQPAVPNEPTVGKPYDKWALLIGVNEFENDHYNDLTGPTNDINTLTSALLRAGFSKGNILTLKDSEVTITTVRDKFDELSQNVGPNSMVLIHVATHGIPGSDGRDGYIICHDTVPDRLYATAYHMNEFRAMAAYIPCAQKVLVQDTCHAAANKNLLFPAIPPLMVVFSSAEANQLAYEEKDAGLFMKYFAKVVSDKRGDITMAEVADYVRENVSERSPRLGSLQTPRTDFGPSAELMRFNY